MNRDKLRELANRALEWREPDREMPDGVPWPSEGEWAASTLPDPDVKFAAACDPELILALLDEVEGKR